MYLRAGLPGQRYGEFVVLSEQPRFPSGVRTVRISCQTCGHERGAKVGQLSRLACSQCARRAASEEGDLRRTLREQGWRAPSFDHRWRSGDLPVERQWSGEWGPAEGASEYYELRAATSRASWPRRFRCPDCLRQELVRAVQVEGDDPDGGVLFSPRDTHWKHQRPDWMSRTFAGVAIAGNVVVVGDLAWRGDKWSRSKHHDPMPFASWLAQRGESVERYAWCRFCRRHVWRPTSAPAFTVMPPPGCLDRAFLLQRPSAPAALPTCSLCGAQAGGLSEGRRCVVRVREFYQRAPKRRLHALRSVLQATDRERAAQSAKLLQAQWRIEDGR